MMDLVLLRRAATTWGLAHSDVGGFAPQGSTIMVSVGGKTLVADQVMGVARRVRVRPLGNVLGRFWGHPGLGAALVSGTPLIVVDPAAPPRELLRDEGELDEH